MLFSLNKDMNEGTNESQGGRYFQNVLRFPVSRREQKCKGETEIHNSSISALPWQRLSVKRLQMCLYKNDLCVAKYWPSVLCLRCLDCMLC